MSSQPTIGVMFRREQPPERLPEVARAVEAAGFAALWVVEDLSWSGGIAQAAAALAATDRIAVGIGVVPAVARNPAFLAMELATLARLHPGRLHAGIGHGVASWMEQVGARPGSWLAAIEETTTAVRSLLAGEQATTDGRHVHIEGVRLVHPPEAPPPVSLGVRGPRSLEAAGRSADGTVLIEGASPAYARWARAHIDAGRREAGVTTPHRLTSYTLCDVDADDPGRARAEVRRALAGMLADPGGAAVTAPLPYADAIARLRTQGGQAALEREIPDAWLGDMAATGTPAEAAASIAALADAGVGEVVLVPPEGIDTDAWLDRVGTQLLPILRRS